MTAVSMKIFLIKAAAWRRLSAPSDRSARTIDVVKLVAQQIMVATRVKADQPAAQAAAPCSIVTVLKNVLAASVGKFALPMAIVQMGMIVCARRALIACTMFAYRAEAVGLVVVHSILNVYRDKSA